MRRNRERERRLADDIELRSQLSLDRIGGALKNLFLLALGVVGLIGMLLLFHFVLRPPV